MPKSPLLRYTLTSLSALVLIPLTYTLITRQDAEMIKTDAASSPPKHHHTTSSPTCSHCADALHTDRQAAKASQIAVAGLLWEKSYPNPATAATSMPITNGMPQAKDYLVGSRQILILKDGNQVELTVKNRYIHTDGTVAINAVISGTPEGKLHMQWNQSSGFFLGQIEYPHSPVAYEITQTGDHIPTITRRSIDQIVCSEVSSNNEVTYGIPAIDEALAVEAETPDETNTSSEEGASVVIPLNSYPSAEAVIYLDFDGQIVTGTSWGDKITAASAGYTAAKITDVWKRVSADMQPFNLNVTTEESVFLNAEPSKRIRCIITPSNEWYGGSSSAGGVAKLRSFTWPGDTPCWIFANNLYNYPKYLAEACSHEIGHTLGLSHDGKLGVTSYYAGHGSGAVGWAPIMGNSYSKQLTQWSKGEYSDPTNTQDDLSIITSNNGFGYRSDDHGNQSQNATPMPQNEMEHVSGSGIIEQQGDVDVFTLESGPGSISIDITPAGSISNLDILAELYDEQGNLIATANPATLLNASINTTVESGTYFLHIRSTGHGTFDTGYSNYASLGSYNIDGQMAAAAVILTPYEITVQSLDENNRQPDSDPDHDGLSNLAEHLLGTDPAVATSSQNFTSMEMTGTSGADFTINLPAKLPADAIYTVEATCNLNGNNWVSIASWNHSNQWTSPSESITITTETTPNGRQVIHISDNSEQTWKCRFMRLNFQLDSHS